ncbi:MAG: hypothetical protein JSV08_10100 [Acidobacteriota bacterium]|nr:MAG: hypothetical protein JSV08_10100 [Acidobacteriota bacterium]
MKNTAICLAMFAAATLAFAQAAPPDLVNFQGVLRDSSDAPLDGAYDMTFRFFDDPAAGNEILIDSHTAAGSGAVTVTGGLFNVSLGGGTVTDGSGPGTYTALTDVFRDYSAVYVEVQVGADPAMTPRIRVVSAAYALNAGTAASSGDADTLDGFDSSQFLRKDIADTAAGVITFTAATTDVRGSLVDTTDSVVNVGDDLWVLGGNIGVGVSPNPTYGGYFKGTVRGSNSSVNENTASTLYGAFNSAQNSDTGGGELFGAYCTASAKGVDNSKSVYGLRGFAGGDGSSTGNHYGVFGEASLATTSGSHYGVYGISGGGATNYGGYFQGGRYGVRSVASVSASTGYGAYNSVQSNDTGTDAIYGTYGTATASGTDNAKTLHGLSGHAIGDASSKGDHYGVYGEAILPAASGIHHGVYGAASGGATNYGGYFAGNEYGARCIASPTASTGYGSHNSAQNGGTGTGFLYGTYGTANAFGTDNEKTVHGVSGHAIGDASSTGDHFALHGVANSITSGGAHYGVFGNASGGATNYGGYFLGSTWGIYTPNDAYVGGTLDLGGGADDDLTTADVTDLTDGGDTSLHVHTTDGDGRYLRKDVDDTAAGVITFTAATTDVRGSLVDTLNATVDVGDDLYVQGGHLGVGVAPINSYGVYSEGSFYGGNFRGTTRGVNGYVDETSQAALYGVRALAVNADTATSSSFYGMYSQANASGASNDKFVHGLTAEATGDAESTGPHFGVQGIAGGGKGNHYGVWGQAEEPSGEGTHYGVYGRAFGGAINWGLYTPNDAYVGGTLDLGGGADDDLTAADVTGLTDGGTTALHTHAAGDADTLDTLDSLQFLRSDVDDTAAGAITFSETIGVGTAPNSDYAVYGAGSVYGGHFTGPDYGVFGESNGTAAASHYGGSFSSSGDTGTGLHLGVYGIASGTAATNYGVYGTASGGSVNWGLYTSGYAYAENLNAGTKTQASNWRVDSTYGSGATGGYGAVRGDGDAGPTRGYLGVQGATDFDGVGSADWNGLEIGVAGISTGATTPGDNIGVLGHSNSTGVKGEAIGTGTLYGVYGDAAGGLTNYGGYFTGSTWGIYTPDYAGIGRDLYIGQEATDDDHYLYFNGGQEYLRWNDSTLQLQVSTDLAPHTSDLIDLGASNRYWNLVWADGFRFYLSAGSDDDWLSFDTYPDLDLIDGMKGIPVTNQRTGEVQLIVDPATVPAIIRGTPTPEDPTADQFVDVKKAEALLFGAVRELRREGKGREAALRDELDLRTPDRKTGRQEMDGNLQIALDKDANDAARFSVFRDGEEGLQEEVFRVDEEGNLYLKGSVRPASLDLAEYHPVSETVEAGDVLVMDPQNPSVLQRCAFESDPRVVGIVSAAPGVELGRSIRQIAAMEPELAARIDDARAVGDKEAEDAAWAQLEEIFKATHAAVALSGTVACKVDAGYGAVEAGDLLVASPTPGHAMKALSPVPGTILGKAMGTLGAGTGTVKVLVMLR